MALAELALANERRCHKATAKAAASTVLALTKEQRRHKAAVQAAASTELALAMERRRHEAATQTAMSAELSLAKERRRHVAAAQAAESAELLLARVERRTRRMGCGVQGPHPCQGALLPRGSVGGGRRPTSARDGRTGYGVQAMPTFQRCGN